ncbi:MAG: histone deacetylase [Pseudomonadota bacterium]
MSPLIWHPGYVAPLRPGHRFPMTKYGYLHRQLVAGGLMPAETGPAPGKAPPALLAAVHDPAYVGRALGGTLTRDEERRIGLPQIPLVVDRARRASAGTLLAARIALERGFAANLAGGSHHAGPDGGAGFCLFNDAAVAAHALISESRTRRIAILDLDVHQGDGTARIFQDLPAVFTVSVHAARNYPARKALSDHDIALADGAEDAAYLSAVDQALELVIAVRPDLVLYNAGVDPWEGDRLGRLAVSLDGLARRERAVLARLGAAGCPVAAMLGGGYGDDPAEVAARHALLFAAAAELRLI